MALVTNMRYGPIREPYVSQHGHMGGCIKVHCAETKNQSAHSPRFSQQYVLNCSIIKVSCNCIPFHVNFALHLAEFITLLRLYICLHCSCNLSLDFLCILISYKMLYWTHMKNIWPWLGWKDRSKHFEQRPLTPVAESAPDVCCVTQISFFSSLLSIEKCSSNKLAR